MNAFMKHMKCEFRAGIRHKQLLLMNYLLPLGFYLLMGSILGFIDPLFRENMIPAMMIFSILAATLMGVPLALTSARENGLFRSYKINSVPAVSILTISALTTVLHQLIVTMIITISAPILFGAKLPENWPNFILVFIVTTICSASISVLIGVISSNSKAAILFSQFIFVTSILLGGLMFPHELLPDIAGRLSKLFPATHSMNAFNNLAMGKNTDFSPWGSIGVLIVGSILAFAMAVYLFRWDQHNAPRRQQPLLGILPFLPFAVSIFLFP